MSATSSIIAKRDDLVKFYDFQVLFLNLKRTKKQQKMSFGGGRFKCCFVGEKSVGSGRNLRLFIILKSKNKQMYIYSFFMKTCTKSSLCNTAYLFVLTVEKRHLSAYNISKLTIS